jgi:drug/metabolite transporter (DMT)-like permease
MKHMNSAGFRWYVIALVAVCALQATGCDASSAFADAAAAGALNFVQGSVVGVLGTLFFGEDPNALIFNSILNSITGGGGGGHGGHG